jgi:hypothetical protein
MEKQIIYVEDKYYPEINRFIEKNYEKITKLFNEEGYDFAYIPVIQKNILDENSGIIRYYYPDVSFDFNNSLKNPTPQDSYTILFSSLKDKEELKSGFICYGFHFYYIQFSYFPILFKSENDLWNDIEWYIQSMIDLESSYSDCNDLGDFLLPKKKNSIYAILPDTYARSKKDRADFSFPKEATQLLSTAEEAINGLKQLGIKELVLKTYLFPQTQRLSNLLITKDYRIILTDYNNMEIHLTPLPKALFLLFLKYPEGILFKNLVDYKEELMSIYKELSNREQLHVIKKSINDVVNSTKNSINEKCSRIREAFIKEFDESLAKNYFITGERSTPKRIKLDRELVRWEVE